MAFAAYIDGTSSSSSATAVVNLASRAVGDFVLVQISRAAVVAPSGVPSGWSSALIQSHASTYGVWYYAKILASGENVSSTWTWAAAAKTLATASVYTGIDATTPIESSTKGTYGTGSAQTLNLGSITTSETEIIVAASCYSTASKTYDLSSQTLTERRDNGSTNPDFWHYMGDKNNAWGGGTFTPSTATNYISAAATYRGGFMAALNPAPPPSYPAGASDPLGRAGFFGV